MSVRLNRLMRQNIVKSLLENAFGDEESELLKEENALAEAVYQDIYLEEIRDLMAQLPDGFLEEQNHLLADFDTEVCRLRLPEGAFLFARKDRIGICRGYEKDHPLFEKQRAWADRNKSLRHRSREAERQAWAVLDSVTTTKRLKEVWPEIEPYVRPHENSDKNLPAVPVGQLNTALGLKPRAA